VHIGHSAGVRKPQLDTTSLNFLTSAPFGSGVGGFMTTFLIYAAALLVSLIVLVIVAFVYVIIDAFVYVIMNEDDKDDQHKN
jgi:uncharacterized membrane protein